MKALNIFTLKMNNLSFLNKLYLKGILWFLLSLFISNFNDLIMKYLGQNLPSVEISFWRFFFGTLSLIPFMIYFGKTSWKSTRPLVHTLRGSLLFVGITLWCYGLTIVPIATVTVLNFSIPLFTLALARIFLKERIGWQRLLATIIGFSGILAILNPTEIGFQPIALVLVLASLMFATLDVINKKFIINESMLSMLFYSALVATILSGIPTYFVWQTPTFQQLGILSILGIAGNLILYCILKAFSAMDASALAPVRYFELVISILFGFFFFQELPGWSTALGAAIIIPSTFFVVRYEFFRPKAPQAPKINSQALEDKNNSRKNVV